VPPELFKPFPHEEWYREFTVKDARVDGSSTKPIEAAIKKISGQMVLRGASGLGKTYFLMQLLRRSDRVSVFLTAEDCKGGVEAAIQLRLQGNAKDEKFLRHLIHVGALDIYIDGLNEVSPDVRSEITTFMKKQFKGNIILTTQPLHQWNEPQTAKVFQIQPLGNDQIIKFLRSRTPYLSDTAVLKGKEYEKACESFLSSVGAVKTDGKEENFVQNVLSNPMDATIVSNLISQGHSPDLFRLREVQYELMAEKFAEGGHEFPLEIFSAEVFNMRLESRREISENQFAMELACMEKAKMVVRRFMPNPEDSKTPRQVWNFRHDKLMEFFILQTFIDPRNSHQKEYFDDPRFRGVYFQLAEQLPLDEAKSLESDLADYASETNDGTVSHEFRKRLNARISRETNQVAS